MCVWVEGRGKAHSPRGRVPGPARFGVGSRSSIRWLVTRFRTAPRSASRKASSRQAHAHNPTRFGARFAQAWLVRKPELRKADVNINIIRKPQYHNGV